MPTLASAINGAHAINTGCLISQSFAGSIANVAVGATFHQYDPATTTENPKGAAFVWAVPVLSSAHTSHTAIINFVRLQSLAGSLSSSKNIGGKIEIRVQTPVGNSTTFDISSSSVLATIDIDATYSTNAASSKTVDITLPFSSTASFVLLALCIDWPAYSSGSANDETAFTVRKFQLYTKPLTSPLPAGIVDCFSGEFEPIGQAATKTGSPFAAALGLSMLQSLSAIDKRRKPLAAYSRCLIEGRLVNHYATTRFRDALQSPRGYPVFTTSLVRNAPRKVRIRLIARITPPRGAIATTTYRVKFAAAPFSPDDFPASNGDVAAQAEQEFTILGNGGHQTCITTFEVTTPAMLGPFQSRHIRVGAVKPETVTTAANIDFFSFWVEPQ